MTLAYSAVEVEAVREMNRARQERLQIMLNPAERKAIDDWRFERRMPSRAAAVRELLRRGLEAEGFQIAADFARSGEFGVLGDNSLRQSDD